MRLILLLYTPYSVNVPPLLNLLCVLSRVQVGNLNESGLRVNMSDCDLTRPGAPVLVPAIAVPVFGTVPLGYSYSSSIISYCKTIQYIYSNILI